MTISVVSRISSSSSRKAAEAVSSCSRELIAAAVSECVVVAVPVVEEPTPTPTVVIVQRKRASGGASAASVPVTTKKFTVKRGVRARAVVEKFDPAGALCVYYTLLAHDKDVLNDISSICLPESIFSEKSRSRIESRWLATLKNMANCRDGEFSVSLKPEKANGSYGLWFADVDSVNSFTRLPNPIRLAVLEASGCKIVRPSLFTQTATTEDQDGFWRTEFFANALIQAGPNFPSPTHFPYLKDFINNILEYTAMAQKSDRGVNLNTCLKRILEGRSQTTLTGSKSVDISLEDVKQEVNDNYKKIVKQSGGGENIASLLKAVLDKRRAGGANAKTTVFEYSAEAETMMLWRDCVLDSFVYSAANALPEDSISANICGEIFVNKSLSVEQLANASSAAFEQTGFSFKMCLIDIPENDQLSVGEEQLEEAHSHIEDSWDRDGHPIPAEDVLARIIAEGEAADGVVDIRGCGSAHRDELFLYDNINTTFMQAVDKWLGHLITKRLVMPSSQNDFKAIFCRKPSSNLWIEDESYFRYICSEYGHKIVRETIDKKTGEPSGECVAAHTVREIEEIFKMAKLRAAGFERRDKSAIDVLTDENVGRVFYKNGFYDIKTRRFVSIEEDPLATTFVRIERDFCSNDKWNSFAQEGNEFVERIRTAYLSALGNKADQDYALRLYADAINGDTRLKQWTLNIGSRNCSKGTIESLLRKIFGSYVTTFSTPILKAGFSDPAASNREIITCKLDRARLAFSNESAQASGFGSASTNTPATILDGLVLKSYGSGGDEVVARSMATNEKPVRCSAKIFININDVPIVTPPDALETAHLISFPFKYEAAGKNASGLRSVIASDPKIKSKFEESEDLQWALTYLIFNAWKDGGTDRELHAPFRSSSMFSASFYEQMSKAKCLVGVFGKMFEVGDIKKDWMASVDIFRKFADGEGRHEVNRSDEMRYSNFLSLQGEQFFACRRVTSPGVRAHGFAGIRIKQEAKEVECGDEDEAV